MIQSSEKSWLSIVCCSAFSHCWHVEVVDDSPQQKNKENRLSSVNSGSCHSIYCLFRQWCKTVISLRSSPHSCLFLFSNGFLESQIWDNVHIPSCHTSVTCSTVWSIMYYIYSLMGWHSSDWDHIFQRNSENKSHALRSININPWLVYCLFWNIHSCFCHFWKSGTKFPVKK